MRGLTRVGGIRPLLGIVESADVLSVGEPASRLFEFFEVSVDFLEADFDGVHLHSQEREEPLLVFELVGVENVLVRVEIVFVVGEELFDWEKLFVDEHVDSIFDLLDDVVVRFVFG